MSAAWVAASARARAVARRRTAAAGVREVAAAPSWPEALAALARAAPGDDRRAGLGAAGPSGGPGGPADALARAQRAAVQRAVWHARVLAGWGPRSGVRTLRALAAWVELTDVLDHLRRLEGADAPPPVALGALATAWPRVAPCATAADVRTALAASVWGDPGGSDVRTVERVLRPVLVHRVVRTVPAAATWARARALLWLAAEQATDAPLPARARDATERALGARAAGARTLPDLVRAAPSDARWALEGVLSADALWEAEARWWSRVERDALALLRRPGARPDVVVGAVALLAVDAWHVRGALGTAARGPVALEVFDALG